MKISCAVSLNKREHWLNYMISLFWSQTFVYCFILLAFLTAYPFVFSYNVFHPNIIRTLSEHYNIISWSTEHRLMIICLFEQIYARNDHRTCETLRRCIRRCANVAAPFRPITRCRSWHDRRLHHLPPPIGSSKAGWVNRKLRYTQSLSGTCSIMHCLCCRR